MTKRAKVTTLDQWPKVPGGIDAHMRIIPDTRLGIDDTFQVAGLSGTDRHLAHYSSPNAFARALDAYLRRGRGEKSGVERE